MKSFLINVKNLIPYLFIVCIYFFFINIEARNTYNNSNKKNTSNDMKSDINKVNLRIAIPVIPYND